MAKITIHGGQGFRAGKARVDNRGLTLTRNNWSRSRRLVRFSEIQSVQIVDSEKKKKLLRAGAGGVVGSLIFWPFAILGILACGNATLTTFQVTLQTGEQILASCRSKDYRWISGRALSG